MEVKYYDQEGKETGAVNLSDRIFNAAWNPNMVYQVVVALRANQRRPYAHTKTRGEVRGGGKKPWRQKGLGKARHGSIRSPIWIGGGVTHGPRKEKNYNRKINKKMKKMAFASVLSRKMKDNEILILDDINLKNKKTKEAEKIIQAISRLNNFQGVAEKAKSVLIAPAAKKEIFRAFGNIPNIKIISPEGLNILESLNNKYLLFLKNSAEALENLMKI